MKKSLPTFVIALSTASSAAVFSSNITVCEKRFGISSSLIRFGLPLGTVINKPATALYNMALIFFFASQYGVSCSPAWLVIGVLISGILAIAMLPIPGGGTVAYSILFLQMGIPTEAMAIALAIDILMDFIMTAMDVLLVQLSLVNLSSRLAMLNKGILRGP